MSKFKFLEHYDREIRACKRCIYDERIPGISFDESGICNYCRQYEHMMTEYPTGEKGMAILQDYVDQMKRDGKGKAYDVVIGVSGGCDSSYMCYLAKEVFGLRVLAAHFDNTYNSKIAVENIHTVLEKLEIDLYTHVVDADEYQRIYKSFFLASVPEIDIPTDLALAVVHYMAAAKYGIKHIWEGHSFRTEGISPPGWFYMDAKYVKTVHRKFGDGKIKTLPMLWMSHWLKWIVVNKIKKFRPLYYYDYVKENAKKFLSSEYGWQWYGGHHMENRTAYFANNYYLPRKFGIDLRYSEFSALIRSGQLTREEALVKIKEQKPFDQDILDEIKRRVGFTDDEFERIMKATPRHFTDYTTYKQTFERMAPLFYLLYKSGYVTKSFYVKYCLTKDS
ncbi:N-acetyl sugar amidotransferase [Fulvivirgaceae bacterium PWU4]|uniref:N-acetyl sugar amidotransferase n=1 Tax=Chryseosolibacter histidini TaxID=2782349 RepID=A0AAP2DTZ8_9BACT|nr:N-acetyl sugar amidotransferase [Chryseosolibacter histidini]MBT1700917.1 N-acetyl sugar amidotransferase [Chryseosolibacter histidini]